MEIVTNFKPLTVPICASHHNSEWVSIVPKSTLFSLKGKHIKMYIYIHFTIMFYFIGKGMKTVTNYMDKTTYKKKYFLYI